MSKGIRMKKRMKRLGAIALAAFMMMGTSLVAFADESSYTYCYDYWGDMQKSPDAYEVLQVCDAESLGLEQDFVNPVGLTISGDMIYVVDAGANQIVQIEKRGDKDYKFVRNIDHIRGDIEINTFNAPNDVAVSEDGNIFVVDTGNNRIVKMDSKLNFITEFVKPNDSTLSADLTFRPAKLGVDTAERVYCTATGINKGLIKYESDGTFSGFVGANEVTFNWTDYIWKRLAFQAQKETMESFVPIEYDDLYIDHEGFIYVVTSKVEAEDLKAKEADAIRRLNLMGSDILIRNGEFPPYGDLYMGAGGNYSGPSRMTDITAFENDVYVALDRNRNRIFAYDHQGRLLFAFGGIGSINGYFRKPVAIDHMDYDLFILDNVGKSITVMTPTTYGNLIYEAIDAFDDGDYVRSGECWEEVMELNGNYDLAYIGIGRSLLRQERYEEALDYFELKYDDENYSKAFKQYRKQWVEENIGIIFTVVFLLLAIPLGIGRIKKIKHEIDIADIFRR